MAMFSNLNKKNEEEEKKKNQQSGTAARKAQAGSNNAAGASALFSFIDTIAKAVTSASTPTRPDLQQGWGNKSFQEQHQDMWDYNRQLREKKRKEQEFREQWEQIGQAQAAAKAAANPFAKGKDWTGMETIQNTKPKLPGITRPDRTGKNSPVMKPGIGNAKNKLPSQWAKVKDDLGQYGKGNIDLYNRKIAYNPDGTYGTVNSFSVNIDGEEVLLPSIIDGKQVTQNEAIDHYYKTGEHLGKFSTPAEADKYAKHLHDVQELLYGEKAKASLKGRKKTQLTPEEREQVNLALDPNATRSQRKQGGLMSPMDRYKRNVENSKIKHDYDYSMDLYRHNADFGGWGGKPGERYYEIQNPKNAAEQRVQNEKLRQQGYFDYMGNPETMSDEGLKDWNAKYSGDVKYLKGRKEELNSKLSEIDQNETDEIALLDLVQTDDPEIAKLREILHSDAASEDEKAEARWQLEDLYDAMGLYDYASRFLSYKLSAKSLNGDQEDTPDLIRKAYDMMNGDGTYDEAVQRMSEEERARFDSWIKEKIGYASEAEGPYWQEMEDVNSQLEYAEKSLAKGQYEANLRSDYGKMISDSEKELKGVNLWSTEYDPAIDKYLDESKIPWDTWASEEEPYIIYHIIGTGHYFENSDTDISKSKFRNAQLMNQDEKDVFMAYMNSGQTKEAMAFYRGLEPYLNRWGNLYTQMDRKRTAINTPILGSVETLANTVAQPSEFLVRLLGSIIGDPRVKDRYSSYYTNTANKMDIRQFVGEQMSPTGKFFYDAGMSGLDSAINMWIGKGLGLSGNALQQVTLGLFSTQAFQSSLYQDLETTNGNYALSVWHAAIDAAIEYGTEVFSVEALMSNPENFLKYVGKVAFAEGSEEFVGAALGPYIKQLTGGRNEWLERANEIFANKEEYGVKNYKEALRIALREWNNNILLSTASGAVSAMGSTGYTGVQSYQYSQAMNSIGRNINAYQANDNSFAFIPQQGMDLMNAKPGQAVQTEAGTETAEEQAAPKIVPAEEKQSPLDQGKGPLSEGAMRVMAQAQEMDPDSKARKLADRLQKRAERGQKIKDGDVGRLFTAVMQESGEDIMQMGEEAATKKIRDLLDNAELTPEQKDRMADLSQRAARNGMDSLTRQERRELRGSKAGMQVYEALTGEEQNETKTAVTEAENEATKEARNKRESIADIGRWDNEKLNAYRKTKQRELSGEAFGEQVATEDDIRMAEDTATREGRKREGGKREVIVDGRFGRVNGMKQVTETDENGTQRNVWKYEVVTDNGETHTVDATDMRVTNPTTAAVIRQQSLHPETYTPSYTNKLMDLMDRGNVGNVAAFLADAEQTRWAAYLGQERPSTGIQQEAAEELWLQSQKEAGEDNTRRTNFRGVGNGRATLLGAEYNTSAWKQKVKELNLTKEEQNRAAYVAQIARMSGINLDITTTEELRTRYGDASPFIQGNESYSGIMLNLDSLTSDKEGAGKKHVVVTFGHEMTHWLKRNSPTAFYALQDYVLKTMNSRMGEKSVRIRAQQLVENYKAAGKEISMGEAVDEIVANACDQVLGSREFMDHLKEDNQGLFRKVQSFVRSLINRFKQAVAGMEQNYSYESLVMAANMNELAKLWLGAYDEALSGMAAKGMLQEAMANPVEEFNSIAPVQMRTDGMIAVHNLYAENLQDDIDMKGLPGISIAVMSQHRTWQGYGVISLFFGRESVDPMMGNTLYNGDAYTPTMGSAQVETTDQALRVLERQPARDMTMAYSLNSRFRDFKRIRNLDEARQKAQARASREAAWENNARADEAEKKGYNLFKNIGNHMKQVYGADLTGRYKTAISDGILYAAEEIESYTELNQAMRRKIVRESIAKAEADARLKQYELNDSLVDQVLDYIDLAVTLATGGEYMEAKSMYTIPFTKVKAIAMPDSLMDSDLVDELVDLGVDRESIYFYSEEDGENSRENVLLEIPTLQEEAAFSIADLDSQIIEDQAKYKDVDLSRDKECYDYDFLKNLHPIKVTYEVDMTGIIAGKNINYSNLIKKGKQNALDNGGRQLPNGMIAVRNEYTNRDMYISNNSIDHSTHSYDNKIYNIANARAGAVIGDLARYGVPVNGLRNSNEDRKLIGTYAIAAPLVGVDGKKKVAILTVERWTGNVAGIEVFDQIHSNSVRKKNEGYWHHSQQAAPSVVTAKAEYTTSRSSRINITEFLDDVNSTHRSILSDDVLRHYEETRPANGYWTNKALFSVATQYNDRSTEELDAEYEDAVNRKDYAHAEAMLLEKLQRTEGVVPFRSKHGYSGKHNIEIARDGIKKKYGEAIAEAAEDMAWRVPENAVLVPMPPHTGAVTEDTDTMVLARAISELTGQPVINALTSEARNSRHLDKKGGKQGAGTAEMGFRQIAEIPEDAMPVFVDNLVGSGTTAKAAHDAIGRGITLAYAQQIRGRTINGLKNVSVTYDKENHLIPLSQRFDLTKSGTYESTWYSMADLSGRYSEAQERGNTAEMQELVNQAADVALRNSRIRDGKGRLIPVYHGTNAEFNVFDTRVSGGTNGTAEGFGIYLTDNPEVSEHYGQRQIAGFANITNPAYGFRKTIRRPQLVSLIRAACEQEAERMVKEDPSFTKADALKDTWISNYVYTHDFSNIRDAYGAVADLILSQNSNDADIVREVMAGMGIRDYSTAMDFYHEVLTPSTGIDGFWLKWSSADGESSNIFLAFDSSQVKSSEAVTYDDNGKPISLENRFDTTKDDIRYSMAAVQPITNEEGEEIGTILPGGTFAANYSLASWTNDGERQRVVKTLTKMFKAQGMTNTEAETEINKYLKDVDSIAAKIASNTARWDYIADRSQKFMKKNSDVYVYSLDASTLCAKRLLYQGTYNAIMKQLPNTALKPGDLIDLANMMYEMGYQTPCGICYVESRRRNTGNAAEQFLKQYKGEYVPNYQELTTTDGLAKLKQEHRQAYDDFVTAMNKRGVGSVKLVQTRTDYRGDVRKMRRSTVDKLNSVGGLRIQSFSDFETPHLIDMMQAVVDMNIKGLKSQAYTKVPAFAWVFGDTGIKINLSLMGDVDENGNLIFDEREGMNFAEAMRLRDRYSKNVGTILVGKNVRHILAAMADPRIDFIIPFHKSGWTAEDFAKMKALRGYEDFQEWQNERTIEGHTKDGKPIYKNVEENLDPFSYWQVTKTGKQNAEIYLKKCAELGIVPKFNNFLHDNGDGSWSLQKDGSTDGYWKLLIDFKMYDNNGRFSPQQVVRPKFNMTEAERIMEEYKGGANTLPVAEPVVERFVREFKAAHPLDEQRTAFSLAEGNMDVNAWMMSLTPGELQTEGERQLLQAYKDLRMKLSLCMKRQRDYNEQLNKLNRLENPTAEERAQAEELKRKIAEQEEKQTNLEAELFDVTNSDGYAGMMYRQSRVLSDFIFGKTQDQVKQAVDSMLQEARRTKAELEARKEELRKLGETQAVRTMQGYMNRTLLNKMTSMLRKQYDSTISKTELESRLTAIALKMSQGESVMADAEALAQDITDRIRGFGSEALERMKGTTFVIGPEQMRQLKAQHSGLKELRSRLRGSGIQVKSGQVSTIERQWEDFRQYDMSLPELGNEGDQVETMVSWVESQMAMGRATEAYGIDMAETTAMVLAAAGNVLQDEIKDPKAKAQVKAILKDVQDLAKKTTDVAEAIDRMEERLAELEKTGMQAVGWASVLQRDVNVAIDYYDKTAKMAAQTERQKVREGLIQTLKSENTRKLMEQQEKYEELIRRDRTARELAHDNESLRKKTNTVVKRLKKLLTEETDRDNIPEEAKPLARQLCSMLVGHDLAGFRRVLLGDRQQLTAFSNKLSRMNQTYGAFDMVNDLNWLVIGQGENADYELHDKVLKALMDIEMGLVEYRNAEGRGNVTLQDRKNALAKIQKAASLVYQVIQARRTAEINGRRMIVYELAQQMYDDMANSRFKGERTTKFGKTVSAVNRAVGYGNLTPEYFFKNLRNSIMTLLHGEFHAAENRSGLEAYRARQAMAEIAEKYGYKNWNGQEKHTVTLSNGKTVTITTEQLMSLYATYNREMRQDRPEDTSHLLNGGFVLAQSTDNGLYGRAKAVARPTRVNETDMGMLSSMLTDEQKAYVDEMVAYMSGDLAELGNEASMKVYGIKKFTESYYFPIRSWGGVLNSRSDAGVANNNENRSMQQGFSKRIRANANNAIEIGDFTPTVMKHIVGMINFNTVGPAVENLNKVLNQQLQHGNEEEGTAYKQNLRAAFEEAYGKNAYEYLVEFMQDVNGGVDRGVQRRTLREYLISVFKKNAVAGSLSVAAQQPLSYIRAAMMINPKYLAGALSPAYWRGSFAEMMKYSGVAVIKDMGKFDMNYGRSMQDYITPEAMKTKRKAALDWIGDKSTSLPQKMDAMTWTRMWSAVKLEQHALHPEMDIHSDEFLTMCAERFNDVMRRTQVYDSVLVKSANMRKNSYTMKLVTSFMAEPTLSLNVLADAWVNMKDKGGKATAVKAAATFILSAIAQAAAKAFFGTGRSPDRRKNREENFLNKFGQNLLNEANPLALIPGYSDLVELLTKGELSDDAMGVVGKAKTIVENMNKLLTGDDSSTPYRVIEDSVGQLLQLMSDVPLKNAMRDVRAMINFFSNGNAQALTGNSYEQRETSGAVLKYQLTDTLMSNDLAGMVNAWLGAAGYGTEKKDYLDRLYEAMKNGDTEAAKELQEYVHLGMNTGEKRIKEEMTTRAKADESLSAEEKLDFMQENEAADPGGWILDQFKDGKISRAEAEKLYLKANPKKTADSVFWTFERKEYRQNHPDEEIGNSDYAILQAAIGHNRSEEIQSAVKDLLNHGYDTAKVRSKLKSYKSEYLSADGNEKIRLKDALTKAYKATGMTAAEAEEEINSWKGGSSQLVQTVTDESGATVQKTLKERFVAGQVTKEQARAELKKANPGISEKDLWYEVDRMSFMKETGIDPKGQTYYRLYHAVETGSTGNVTKIVSDMVAHGVKKSNIPNTLMKKFGQTYLSLKDGSPEKVKLKNSLIQAMKAAGKQNANDYINKWVKKQKKKK